MSGAPAWVEGMAEGLGALVVELERARDGGEGVTDWPALMEKAQGLGAHVSAGASEYSRIIRGANEQLATASKKITTLQGMVRELEAKTKMAPGVGAPGTGLGSSQTVYISAGATAGIAAGALLLGGVGGYAAKAFLDVRKKKKAAAAREAGAEEPEETEEELEDPEPKPKRIARKVK